MKKILKAQNPIMVRAAKELVSSVKDPYLYIEFLGDLLDYAASTKEIPEDCEPHYFLLRLLKKVAVPWVAGGPVMIEAIADGYTDMYFDVGFIVSLKKLRGCFILLSRAAQDGCCTGIYEGMYTAGISSLLKLASAFELMSEEENNKEAKKN